MFNDARIFFITLYCHNAIAVFFNALITNLMKNNFTEDYLKNHSGIVKYKNFYPLIHKEALIAPNCIISGNTEIAQGVGIWYFCVIRGDVASIKIGKNSNVQDGTTIHGTRPNHIANKTGSEGGKTTIGENVTIGHNCIIHAATIQDNAFIGMGSIVMDLSVVQSNAMLAAGSVLSPGKVVKSGELWGGVPAKKLRDLRQEEIDYIKTSADNYKILAEEYFKY